MVMISMGRCCISLCSPAINLLMSSGRVGLGTLMYRRGVGKFDICTADVRVGQFFVMRKIIYGSGGMHYPYLGACKINDN